MFESLGYAERKISRRQIMALPLAVALQLALGTMYMAHYLFSPETLQPPTAWINALPVIPVTLPAAQRTPRTETDAGRTGPKIPGLVSPDTSDLRPPGPETPSDTRGDTGDPGGFTDPGGIDGQDPVSDSILLPPVEAPRALQAWQLVEIPKLLRQVSPAYPPAALAMGLGGRVVLQVVVDEEGRVSDVRVMQSTNALFDHAAMDAVRQWQYSKPLAKAGGQTVACYLTVVVNFQPR